ncbi:MAG TPA: GMC family oxidoreductase [Anaerolineales bacterium]
MNRKADAVVIGSGAAGSVMAYKLACRGLKVIVVERGARQDPQTFEHNELAMFPRLYKQGGLQTTADHDLTIAQGAAVGGSTVINNAIWLRADLERILPDWERAGASVPAAALNAAYQEIESALHVSPLVPQLANKASDVFLRGCEILGIPAGYLQNNRDTCIACGWCNYGCRYNRKTSMLVTYIPWAEARGAEVLDQCQDAMIVTNGNVATGVRFTRLGEEITVEADRVVVCAGTIGSSEVLLKSGISLDGRVGQGLHVLGGLLVLAETNEILDGFDGIGLTCIAEASDEYVIESYFAPPLVFSLSLGGWFLTHFRRMMRYRYFAGAGIMTATDPVGRVTLDKKGRVRIQLAFSDRDLQRLRLGIRTLAQIFFAGGAIRVIPATYKLLEFARPEEIGLVDEQIGRPEDLLLGSAHPQGGNIMSGDPQKGVVDNDFSVHGYQNLYVADASVFPTNIWANCQATVMAMAHYASSFVAQ